MYYKKTCFLLLVFFLLPCASFAQEPILTAPHVINSGAKEEMIDLTLTMLAKNTQRRNRLIPSPEPAKKESAKSDWLGLEEKYFGIHGYLENRNYYHVRKNNAEYYYYEFRNNLRLSKELNFSPRFHGLTSIDARLYHFDNHKDGFRQKESRLRLWEGYLDYYTDKFDLRLGQQLIRWGKSDEVNPTDVFTPEDLSEFFNEVERAKRKIPVLAAKANYFINDIYSLESIWTPFFTKTRFDNVRGGWEPYLSRYYRSLGLDFVDDRPGKQIKNSGFAAKFKREGENSDVSLSYSYHYSEQPGLEVNLLNMSVHQRYPRQQTIGTDFETVIGKYGIRGEAAYTTQSPFVSYDPQVTKGVVYRDAFNSIAGIDYTFANNLYCNLQYTQQLIADYPEMTATQQLEDSIVWRITKDYLQDTLTFKTTGRYYLSSLDLLLEIACSYKVTDKLNITLGYDLFAGQETSTFGQYRKNNQVFTRLKYSF